MFGILLAAILVTGLSGLLQLVGFANALTARTDTHNVRIGLCLLVSLPATLAVFILAIVAICQV